MGINARMTLSPSRLISGIDDEMKKAVADTAAYLMRSARNAIRRSAYPSAAGTPPHTRNGRLKHAITFKLSQDGRSAEVGVGAFSGVGNKFMSIAALHEYGGRQKAELQPPVIGETGPIAVKGRWMSGKRRTGYGAIWQQFAFVKLRSDAQVQRSRSLYAKFFGISSLSSEATYPERPFMQPALLAKWPEIFRRLTQLKLKGK